MKNSDINNIYKLDGKVPVSKAIPFGLQHILAMFVANIAPTQVNRYRSRISGPLLDRIDIQVEVSNVDYDDLSSTENSETSAEIKKRVNKTRKLQLERYKDYNIYSNSQLDAGMLKKFCPLGEEENAILRAAFDNLGLSARAHSRILKVARTIADLEGSENIKSEHIAEAIQYRSLDRKYFE